MEYITCGQAQEISGLSIRRLQQMCKNGEIEGAVKKGKVWMIPTQSVSQISNNNTSIINKTNKLPLPIGVSDFKRATSDYYYVDKTMLIKDFIDNKSLVSLFTRPRRFGKTLNMDMLRVFFEKTEDDNSSYFKDKLIWKCDKKYRSYQGKYPVIFISFKDVKFNTWDKTIEMIKKLITLEFIRHIELENSNELNIYEKNLYVKFADESASDIEYSMALQYLSIMLNKHYKEKAIIIIDEYDTPIEQGYTYGFYDSIINFMRVFFSSGLKDGTSFAYGFLTGILRVAKESIFSGLNNIKINSILDKEYSEYFGFTKEEVREMLEYYDVSQNYEEVCKWYDGYLFGDTEIFNPWSIINYISDDCILKPYWQSTGSNDIIGEIISKSSNKVIENLYKLLAGETVITFIDTNVIYPEIQTSPHSIYSFLLVAGYLKAKKVNSEMNFDTMYELSIPNKEIAFVYEKEIIERYNYNDFAISLQQALYNQDIECLQKSLEDFMLESISYYDAGNEGFYHGMILGLCAIMNNRYYIKSNGEVGYGRFDIQLIPKAKSLPGVIIELKHAKNDKENLEELAQLGLNQIEEKKYDANMKTYNIKDIIKISIAFRGKKVIIKKR